MVTPGMCTVPMADLFLHARVVIVFNPAFLSGSLSPEQRLFLAFHLTNARVFGGLISSLECFCYPGGGISPSPRNRFFPPQCRPPSSPCGSKDFSLFQDRPEELSYFHLPRPLSCVPFKQSAFLPIFFVMQDARTSLTSEGISHTS